MCEIKLFMKIQGQYHIEKKTADISTLKFHRKSNTKNNHLKNFLLKKMHTYS